MSDNRLVKFWQVSLGKKSFLIIDKLVMISSKVA